MPETRLIAPLSDRFVLATSRACLWHRDQARKGTQIPYVSHLFSVAALTLEYGGDEDCAIAALLHDAVEDGGGPARLAEIRSEFGEQVAAIVAACTDTDEQPKPPWPQRKQAYIDHVAEKSAEARLVSACDKLHNARSILSDVRELGDGAFERFKGGKAGTLWYYRKLVDAFRLHGRSRLFDELDLVVTELERLTAG